MKKSMVYFRGKKHMRVVRGRRYYPALGYQLGCVLIDHRLRRVIETTYGYWVVIANLDW